MNNNEITPKIKSDSIDSSSSAIKKNEREKKFQSWRGHKVTESTSGAKQRPVIALFREHSNSLSESPSELQKQQYEKKEEEQTLVNKVRTKLVASAKSPFRTVSPKPQNATQTDLVETQTKSTLEAEVPQTIKQSIAEQPTETKEHSTAEPKTEESHPQSAPAELQLAKLASSFSQLPLTPEIQQVIAPKGYPKLKQNHQFRSQQPSATALPSVKKMESLGGVEKSKELEKSHQRKCIDYLDRLKQSDSNKEQLVRDLKILIETNVTNKRFCEFFFNQIKKRISECSNQNSSNNIQTSLLSKKFEELKNTEEIESNVSTEPEKELLQQTDYSKLDEKTLLIVVFFNAIMILKDNACLLYFQTILSTMCPYSARVKLIVEKFLGQMLEQERFIGVFEAHFTTNSSDTKSWDQILEESKVTLFSHRWYMTTDQLILILTEKMSREILKEKKLKENTSQEIMSRDFKLFIAYLKGIAAIVEAPVFFITSNKLTKLYDITREIEVNYSFLLSDCREDLITLRQSIVKRKMREQPKKIITAIKEGKVYRKPLSKMSGKRLFSFDHIEAIIGDKSQNINSKKLGECIENLAMELKQIEAKLLSQILHREFVLYKPGNSSEILLCSVNSNESTTTTSVVKQSSPSNSSTSVTQTSPQKTHSHVSGPTLTIPHKANLTQNICRYIKYSNLLTLFVATKISTAPTIAISSRWLTFFIRVMASSMKLGNYNTAMFLKAAFCHNSVSRLNEVWRMIEKEDQKNWDNVDTILASNNAHFTQYWKDIQTKESQMEKFGATHKNCLIPLFSQFLSKFTFCNEGIPKINPTGELNDARIKTLAELHFDFYRYQRYLFLFETELLSEKYTFNFMDQLLTMEEGLYHRKMSVEEALEKLYKESGKLVPIPAGYDTSTTESTYSHYAPLNTVETESQENSRSATIYTTPSTSHDDFTFNE